MKTNNKQTVTAAVAVSAKFGRAQEIVQTRIGELSMQNGIPSKESIAKLYDEMDFQRATQAYIWATPAVHFNEWAFQMKQQMEVQGTDGRFTISRDTRHK
jgi:hypothetical protein